MFGLPSLPRWAWYVIGIGLALLAFYIALDRYGDSRFRAGEAHADAAWKKASDELLAKAANARTEADKAAAARQAEYAAKVEDERGKIAKATAEGSSPFDVLFGGK